MAKVLLLEDDADLSTKIVHFLTAKSHVIEHVSSGDDAWLRLQTYGYDVLILDWNVPGMSGNELCRKYRGNGGDVPILMITARTEDADLEAGFSAGVDDYLKKPFSPHELLCRMLAVLRRQPKTPTQISHIGNLSFHHTSRELFVGNKAVSLQPQERAILDYLLKNRAWITPGDLASLVGEGTTSVDTIRMSVMNLRKKLVANGGTPVIMTSRGEGYMVSYDETISKS